MKGVAGAAWRGVRGHHGSGSDPAADAGLALRSAAHDCEAKKRPALNALSRHVMAIRATASALNQRVRYVALMLKAFSDPDNALSRR